MAFGFFKKAEKADIIFKGGKIFTQDADLPWAEAVACKDGEVLAVGSYDELAEFEGSDTEIIDLNGSTMLPGFIDMGGDPAIRVFKEAYEDFSYCESWEDFLAAIKEKLPDPQLSGISSISDIFSVAADDSGSSEGAANLSNGDSVFGGSFDGGLGAAERAGGIAEGQDLEGELPEEGLDVDVDLEHALFAYSEDLSLPFGKDHAAIREELDSVSGKVPVLLLLGRLNAVILNTSATEYASAMAQANGVMQVTLPFLIEIFDLIDFEDMQRKMVDLAAGYCERGFTSVVNNGFIDYFDQTYTDMLIDAYGNDMQKQRLFGKLGMRIPSNPEILVRRLRQRQTLCTDLRPAFNADGLQLDITTLFGLRSQDPGEAPQTNSADKTEDNADDNDSTTNESGFDDTVYLDILHEQVYDMCFSAADAGMNIKICVHNKDIALEILDVFSEIRDKGYRRNIFTICHELEFDDDERANYGIGETIMEAGLTGCEYTDNSKAPGSGGFTMNVGAPEITGGLGANALCCAGSVEEAIDMLTYDAAVELDMDSELGSIAKGKLADFAIFDKNPLECKTIDELRKLRARQTVLGGRIVYDEDEEVAEEWYNLLINQQY